MADIDKYNPHEHGRHTVGASDVPVILGLSPYSNASPWKTWGELAGLLPYREGGDTRAQRRGKLSEALIGANYAETKPALVLPNSMRFVGALPWMHATPDFDCRQPGQEWPMNGDTTITGVPMTWAQDITDWGGSWFMEAKSSREDPWEDLRYERPDYWLQASWQAQCGHRGGVDLAAWFTIRDEFRTYWVPRDFDLEARMRARVWAWYERHVVDGYPPEVDDRAVTGRIMARIYQKVTKEPVTAQDTDRERLRQLSAIQDEIARLQQAETLLQNQIRARIGPHQRLVDAKGKNLASWSIESKPRIRWGDMVRENPELADRYRTGDRPRRLTVTKRGKEQ